MSVPRLSQISWDTHCRRQWRFSDGNLSANASREPNKNGILSWNTNNIYIYIYIFFYSDKSKQCADRQEACLPWFHLRYAIIGFSHSCQVDLMHVIKLWRLLSDKYIIIHKSLKWSLFYAVIRYLKLNSPNCEGDKSLWTGWNTTHCTVTRLGVAENYVRIIPLQWKYIYIYIAVFLYFY